MPHKVTVFAAQLAGGVEQVRPPALSMPTTACPFGQLAQTSLWQIGLLCEMLVMNCPVGQAMPVSCARSAA